MAGVTTTHREYNDNLELWQRCSDVESGQRAMHRAGEKYLPKNGAESDEDYKSRLARSDFFNAFYRTVSGLSGMAFRKDPAIELPGAMDGYLIDIDLAGTTLITMAKGIVEDVLEYGRIGLLVDHPPRPENVAAISQAVADTLGLRPALKVYDAKAIINWRTTRLGNRTILQRVVLREEHEVEKDEFEADCVTRYRVLDLDDAGQYRQRVFERKDDKDILVEGPIYPQMNGAAMAEIPFRILGVNGMGFDCEEPPLIDLVDANIAHYQVNSDMRVAMHFGVPTFYITGYVQGDDEAPLVVGSRTAIVLPDPNAKVGFAEPEGAMIPQMAAAIKELEQRMAILGARMIADETRQAETLGATEIKREGEYSVMASITLAVSDAITWALEAMRDWAGIGGDVVFAITREFNPRGLSAQDLTAIFAGVQQGLISEREAFDLMQRGDIIDGAKDFETHQEETQQSAGPVRPVQQPQGPIAA